MIAPKARDLLAKGAEMGLVLAGGLLAAVASTAGVQAADAKPSACDAFVGVWEYLPPSAPGHAVIGKVDTGDRPRVGSERRPASNPPKTAPSLTPGRPSSTRAAAQAPGSTHARHRLASCASRSVGCSAGPRRNWSGRSSLSRLNKTATKPNGGGSSPMASAEQWEQADSFHRRSDPDVEDGPGQRR